LHDSLAQKAFALAHLEVIMEEIIAFNYDILRPQIGLQPANLPFNRFWDMLPVHFASNTSHAQDLHLQLFESRVQRTPPQFSHISLP